MQRADDFLLPIPEEVHLHIFKYFSLKDFSELELVNHSMRRLATDNGFWRFMYTRDFPELAPIVTEQVGHEADFRQLYRGASAFHKRPAPTHVTAKRKRNAEISTHEAISQRFLTPAKKSRHGAAASDQTQAQDLEIIRRNIQSFNSLYSALLTQDISAVRTVLAAFKKIGENYLDTIMALPYIHKSGFTHYSLLHVAIQTRNTDIVAALLEECHQKTITMVFQFKRNHKTLLHLALMQGDYQMADFLLQHPATKKNAEKLLNTPKAGNLLNLAIELNNPKMIEYLVNKGAELTTKLQYEYSKATHGAGHASVSRNTHRTITPILYAASLGHTEAFDVLARLGADFTATDSFGNNALHLAIRSKNIDLVQQLESLMNPQLDAPNKQGQTPTQLAARLGYNHTTLLAQPNLTPSDYEDIFLRDLRLARNRPSRLKDVLNLLKDKDIFATMQNGQQKLQSLLDKVKELKQANPDIEDYEKLYRQLFYLHTVSHIRSAPGMNFFPSVSNDVVNNPEPSPTIQSSPTFR